MCHVLIVMVVTDIHIFQNPSVCAVEVWTLSYALHTLLKRGRRSLVSSGAVCGLLGLQEGCLGAQCEMRLDMRWKSEERSIGHAEKVTTDRGGRGSIWHGRWGNVAWLQVRVAYKDPQSYYGGERNCYNEFISPTMSFELLLWSKSLGKGSEQIGWCHEVSTKVGKAHASGEDGTDHRK